MCINVLLAGCCYNAGRPFCLCALPPNPPAKVPSNSPSLGSLRGTVPECILEDSGFGEQQEFRTRCSSLAGSLQRRPREGALKAPPTRRRHASAPNHVQPSDADKNRTMLFQVLIGCRVGNTNVHIPPIYKAF